MEAFAHIRSNKELKTGRSTGAWLRPGPGHLHQHDVRADQSAERRAVRPDDVPHRRVHLQHGRRLR